jgi:hypothetical protein
MPDILKEWCADPRSSVDRAADVIHRLLPDIVGSIAHDFDTKDLAKAAFETLRIPPPSVIALLARLPIDVHSTFRRTNHGKRITQYPRPNLVQDTWAEIVKEILNA